jgi:hypothetical protein
MIDWKEYELNLAKDLICHRYGQNGALSVAVVNTAFEWAAWITKQAKEKFPDPKPLPIPTGEPRNIIRDPAVAAAEENRNNDLPDA